jgi:DNA repair protein RecO (recombination protein O)
MKQVVAQAIILNRVDYGESDRIMTLLTRDHGKLPVLAKGVRKSRSKIAGSMELFSVIDITFIDGKSNLKTIISARLLRHFGSIAKDLPRTMFAYDVLKLLDKVIETECDAHHFELLEQTLSALDNVSVPLELTKAWFYARLLELMGYEINTETDSAGKPLSGVDRYAFVQDELSFSPSEHAGNLTASHIKLLRLISVHSPDRLLRVEAVESYCAQLSHVLELSIRVHIL